MTAGTLLLRSAARAGYYGLMTQLRGHRRSEQTDCIVWRHREAVRDRGLTLPHKGRRVERV